MSDLRTRMQRELDLCGLAESSQRVYLSAVSRMARHFNRSPAQLTTRDIQDYWLTLKPQPPGSDRRGSGGRPYFYCARSRRPLSARSDFSHCLPSMSSICFIAAKLSRDGGGDGRRRERW